MEELSEKLSITISECYIYCKKSLKKFVFLNTIIQLTFKTSAISGPENCWIFEGHNFV